MKAHTTALANLLITGNYVFADLFEIVLRSGARILWTDSQDQIKLGADTYLVGPAIDRGPTSEQIGLASTSTEVTVWTDQTDLISGVPVIPYICQGGFFNANVRIHRAYAPDWATMAAAGPTGAIIRFSGRMGEITAGGGTQLTFSVDSWTILLDASMPRNVVQPRCVHNLYDAGCTITKASKAVAGVVSVVSSASAFTSTLANPVGYFDLGFVLFTSGGNAGQQRTVRSYGASGAIQLVLPLPAVPAPGDTFTAYPGCDLLQSTCGSAKFANLAHFKGEPFVPAVETSV